MFWGFFIFQMELDTVTSLTRKQYKHSIASSRQLYLCYLIKKKLQLQWRKIPTASKMPMSQITFFFQLLGFIHLCHDNVKAAAAAVLNSPSKAENSSSFELDIEGQAVRMSWCRRAAHATALLRRKTDHGAKTIWDTM